MENIRRPHPARSPTLERLPGMATPFGSEYEYKLAGLLALRARRRGLRFQLFSNVAAMWPVDDLVMRVLAPQQMTIFFQLKHTNRAITESVSRISDVSTQAFTSSRGGYALPMYFECFTAFQQQHATPFGFRSADEELLHDACGDDVRIALVTNRAVRRRRAAPDDAARLAAPDDAARPDDFPLEDLIRTDSARDDAVFSFGPEDTEVWSLYDNDPAQEVYQREFLPRLRIFSEQAHSEELDGLIRQELEALILPRCDVLMRSYVTLLREWAFRDEGRCLSNTSGEMEKVLVHDLQTTGRTAAGSGALRFEDARCLQLRERLRETREGGGGGSLRVRVRGVPQGHRAAKLFQLLDEEAAERWVYVGDRALREFPLDALQAACGVVEVLVLDAEEEMEAARALVASVDDSRLQVVVVAASREEEDAGLALPAPRREAPAEEWALEQLTEQAQDALLDATVLFQGEAMPLRALEAAWPGLRQQVDGPLLSALAGAAAEGRPWALGVAPPALDDAHCHVARSLRHSTLLDPAVLTALDPTRHLLALSGFSAAELPRQWDEPSPASSALARPGLQHHRWVRLEDTSGAETQSGLDAAFRTLCDSVFRSVHWIERAGGDGGALLWRKTRGEAGAVAAFAQSVRGGRCAPQGPTCVHAEEDAGAWAARVLLLLGEPGAGKSSFLLRGAAEARRRAPARWHVVVQLRHHWKLLNKLPPPAEMAKKDVLELLAAAAGAVEAARRSLEAALFHSGELHVFVDGVDEVVPAHKEKALRLMGLFLQDAHPAARLWVACRPEAQASLCRVLLCAPVSLVPLSPAQQLDFLTRRWASKLNEPTTSVEPLAQEMIDAVAHIRSTPEAGFSHAQRSTRVTEVMLLRRGFEAAMQAISSLVPEEHTFQRGMQSLTDNMREPTPSVPVLSDEVTQALNVLQRTLGASASLDSPMVNDLARDNAVSPTGFHIDDYSLLQTPFYLNLVAEGFVNAAADALRTGSNLHNEKFNQVDIFDMFIQVERDHFEENRGRNPNAWFREMEDDSFKQILQTYALKIFSTFFAEAQTPGLETKIVRFRGHIPKEKTGILWQPRTGEPQFVHFSFIEFFVSTWLHDNLTGNHSEQAKRLVRALLQKETCRAVLLFLDLRLAEGLRAHQAVLAGDAAALQEALARGDPADALDAGGRSALHLAAAYGASGAVGQLLAAGARSNLEGRDAVLGWTPLQYAYAALRMETVERLLAAGADRTQIFNLQGGP